MGSGSRIDHQHHLIATTASASISTSDDAQPFGAAEEQQHLISEILRLGQRIELGQATDAEAQRFTEARNELRSEWGNDDIPSDTDGLPESAPDDDERVAQEARDLEEQVLLGQATIEQTERLSELHERLQPAEDRAVQRAAAQQVLDEMLAEQQAATALHVQARDRLPDEPAVSYEEDFDAFQRAYDAARERTARGEAAIPYLTEDATGGLGARDGGRGFGVELEFDVDGDYDTRSEARERIALDMYRAGLSRDEGVHGYHAQQYSGYTDAANAWRMETDCTVTGEIVSPILYDEPATWQNLATMCEIIERHGGHASFRTGGHVHVGMHDYGVDVANHFRLMQTYKAYEDVLYRLAQNPGAPGNLHRGPDWCTPNRVPADGYRDLYSVEASAHHGQAVNLSGARGRQSDHGEFRIWDGSLNPSVIQTQVKLSLGITAAAVRDAGSTHRPAGGDPVQLGGHRQRLREAGLLGRRLTGEQWRTSTLNFRRLVDEVFHRSQDKEQATALFASTRWQRR
ncbi:amidoligase family protein [Streptomyces aureoversilis]|uniref:Amidoligase family protein n=1 Tax=Streptomyces aureoversilis TaxID=67277 RepID=A0ABW0ABC8_9ACTN